MAVHAFLSFFDKAKGESILKGKEGWIELRGWDWEIEAETSWTKGGGAAVGKPAPGALRWQHDFDTSSAVIMGTMCTGKAFPKAEIQVLRTTTAGAPASVLTVVMEGVYITKVSTSCTEEGNVLQAVEMVSKTIRLDYVPQHAKTGKAGKVVTFNWDIPAGTASPSA